MAKKKLTTVLTFVQDETGSMGLVEEATISAFNEYFKTLKDDKDIKDVTCTILQFSDCEPEERVRVAHDGPLADVQELTAATYRPRGVTPLLDAVGTAIRQAEGKKADRYLLIVQTDGHENASRDFSREQVVKLVAEKQAADNWTLLFLGSGIDNWAESAVGMFGAAVMDSAVSSAKVPYVAYGAMGQSTLALLRSASVSNKSMAAQTQALVDEEEKKDKKKH